MLRSVTSARTSFAFVNKANAIINRHLNGLTIGVPKESLPGEARVALTPVHVGKLKKAGAKISVQAGAGIASGFQDILYKDAGAEIVDDKTVWKSQVITKVYIF
jgi:alanine dehydrogenase